MNRDPSFVDYERERGLGVWRTYAGHALAIVGCATTGTRCRKCSTSLSDRRRPARHHRDCPLRGAGRWKPLLDLVHQALWMRARALNGSVVDSLRPHVLGWTLVRVLGLVGHRGPDQVEVPDAWPPFRDLGHYRTR
jgi:hypothetical protein